MQVKIMSIIFMMAVIGISCSNKSFKSSTKEQSNETIISTDVSYTVAKRYFVRNDYKNGDLVNPKITSNAEFEKYFGTATVMGVNGKPTVIDFSRQYVVAVIGELTDRNTEIVPVSLKQSIGKIYLSYKINEGEKRSVNIRPVLLLVIDNQFEGEIGLIRL